MCLCQHKLHIYQIGIASFSVVSKCKKQPPSTHSSSQRREPFGVVTKPMFLFPRNVHVCWHDKASVCVRFPDATLTLFQCTAHGKCGLILNKTLICCADVLATVDQNCDHFDRKFKLKCDLWLMLHFALDGDGGVT